MYIFIKYEIPVKHFQNKIKNEQRFNIINGICNV